MSAIEDQSESVTRFGPRKVAAALVAAFAFMILTPYVSGATFFKVTDFSAFYAAGKGAGTPTALYNLENYQAIYRAVFVGKPDGYGWFYPPHFLLLQQALAGLTWSMAKAVWLVGTYAIFIFGMRLHAKSVEDYILLLLAPAALMNLYAAQTGFLAAGLLGFMLAGFRDTKQKPGLSSGISLGLLTFKPHLWLFFPVFLVIQRRWTIILYATATFVALFALSVFAYGLQPWYAMLNGALGGYDSIHSGKGALVGKMSTLLALSTMTVGSAYKLSIYAVGLIVACLAVFKLVKIQAPSIAIASFAVVVSFVLAPHNMQYDYMILLLPCFLSWPYLAKAGKIHLLVGILPYVWPILIVAIPGAATFPFGAIVVMLFAIAIFHASLIASKMHDQEGAL